MKRSSPFLSRNKRIGRGGAILFMAVGAIAILMILAVGTTSSVVQELRLAKFVRNVNVSVFEAASVPRLMRVLWIHDETPAIVTLYDLRPRSIVLGGDTAEAAFSDEESRINIRTAPAATLGRLPGLLGQEELVERIKAAGPLFKEELLLIEGMTREIYDQFKDLVTTYGAGAVNINTAAQETLTALGIGDDLTAKIRTYRTGGDGVERTEDDRVFSFPAEIADVLEPYGLGQADRELLEGLISSGLLGAVSEYVRCDIEMKKGGLPEEQMQRQKANRSFRIVLNVPSGMIVQWNEL